MIEIFFVVLFFLQSVHPSALPDIPGVYFLHNSAGWIAMNDAPVVKMKTKGMKTFVNSGGYTNLGVSIFFRGAKASVRATGSIPRFFMRKIGTSKDAIIVRLTQKGDQRECHTSPSSATQDNKKGFKEEDVLKLAVSENPDGSFSAIPEGILKPGEYLLITGESSSGYDFGID